MSNPDKLRLVAVAVADLHLSSKPPAFRSCEPDWLKTQAGYLDQLRRLVTSPLGEQKIPVLCAGDIWDKWSTNPDAINMALAHLPLCHGVFGNHDLPNHNPKELRRSAWWTLVKAGKMIPLEPGNPVEIQSGGTVLRLHGFPFGSKVRRLKEPHDLALEIAVVHQYVWTKKSGYYHGAPEDQRIKNMKQHLLGYDVALFGDNHSPFDVAGAGKGFPVMCNLGGFLRRKSDEQDYRPSVGLIFSDGTVKRHYLDTSGDRFLEGDALAKVVNGIGFETFIESLSELGDSALNFTDAVRHTLDQEKVSPEVKRIILNALDNAGEGK